MPLVGWKAAHANVSVVVANVAETTSEPRRLVGLSLSCTITGGAAWIVRQSLPSHVEPTDSQTDVDWGGVGAEVCSRQHDLEEHEPPVAADRGIDETEVATSSFGQSRHSVPSAQMQLGRTPPTITVRNISPHVMTIRGSC